VFRLTHIGKAPSFALGRRVPTAVIIARDPRYGHECQDAFRQAGVFPVVVHSADRALVLLRQFRTDVVVLEHDDDAGESPALAVLAQPTPLLTYPRLPPPAMLAEAVRDMVQKSRGAPL